jgi:uncharacterized BrkB/YihY/UPF0761 family membrane protein
MIKIMELIISILTVLLCGFILVITIISHMALKDEDLSVVKEQIRHMSRDTVGRKVYRWSIVLFALNGFYWGLSPVTYAFLFAAVLTERLIIYRLCRAGKDPIGKFLVKIDW